MSSGIGEGRPVSPTMDDHWHDPGAHRDDRGVVYHRIASSMQSADLPPETCTKVLRRHDPEHTIMNLAWSCQRRLGVDRSILVD